MFGVFRFRAVAAALPRVRHVATAAMTVTARPCQRVAVLPSLRARIHSRVVVKRCLSTAAPSVQSTIPEVSRSELSALIDARGAGGQSSSVPAYVLIDVRQPEELAHGVIPTSVNVPLGEVADALGLSADAFQSKYGFAKPEATQRVIFHCKSGARSEAATAIAITRGFTRAANYRGSFIEWFGRRY